jgi:AcrR family transcriptional regulator
MKLTPEPKTASRGYRQTARAATAEANAERIVEAFRHRLARLWFDEIRLEDVAADADVAVQTIIRRFGGKDGLLEAAADSMAVEIMDTRGVPVGDPAAAIRSVIDDYEITGDLILRVLAQEARHAPLHRLAEKGRTEHRAWVAAVFAPWLETLDTEAARQRLDALVVATDLYIWKLVRRDMDRPAAELAALMARLIEAALAE